jgi:hypothetical protein
MRDILLIDELHISIFVPRRIDWIQSDRISRRLKSPQFRADLRRAVRGVFRRYRLLRTIRMTITR